jgi:hypothetical protein
MRNGIRALVVVAVSAGFTRAGDDLGKALKAVIGADSYAFSVAEGSGKTGVEAKYQKDMPLYCRADKIDFFRQGKILVYKQKDDWQRTRTGTLSDPLLILAASARVRAVVLPHEELGVLGKALKNVKQADKMLTGELAAEAAKKLARTEDRDLARGGAVKIWLDDAGRLVKYEVAIRVQGVRGNAEVDGVMTRTTSITGVGAIKVDVPAAAKKLLQPAG